MLTCTVLSECENGIMVKRQYSLATLVHIFDQNTLTVISAFYFTLNTFKIHAGTEVSPCSFQEPSITSVELCLIYCLFQSNYILLY